MWFDILKKAISKAIATIWMHYITIIADNENFFMGTFRNLWLVKSNHFKDKRFNILIRMILLDN